MSLAAIIWSPLWPSSFIYMSTSSDLALSRNTLWENVTLLSQVNFHVFFIVLYGRSPVLMWSFVTERADIKNCTFIKSFGSSFGVSLHLIKYLKYYICSEDPVSLKCMDSWPYRAYKKMYLDSTNSSFGTVIMINVCVIAWTGCVPVLVDTCHYAAVSETQLCFFH